MHVSEIWRYPVKSMLGESIAEADLDEFGIVGDRCWATRDLDAGGIRGAKKLGLLMQLGARARGDDGGEVEICFPDGTTMTTTDPDVHRRVGEAIGREVRLEALRPATDLDHYRRGRPESDDPLAEIRQIMDRDDDEPLPDFSIFPPEIFEYESPPGTYYDAYPLMIMTTSALRSLAEALPDSVIDVRRFRPSFVLDSGTERGHPERAWPRGARAQVGGAVIEVVAPCPRCVMPTRAIGPDVPADRRILRHIVAELDQNVGVYARVVQSGRMVVGDTWTWV